MLTKMVANVGQMPDAVEKAAVRENTIVIFTSDNGLEFIRPWDGWTGPLARAVLHCVGRRHSRAVRDSLAGNSPWGGS